MGKPPQESFIDLCLVRVGLEFCFCKAAVRGNYSFNNRSITHRLNEYKQSKSQLMRSSDRSRMHSKGNGSLDLRTRISAAATG